VCIVHRQLAPDPGGSCTNSHHDWLACGKLLACRRRAWPPSPSPSPTGQHCQNGVHVL